MGARIGESASLAHLAADLVALEGWRQVGLRRVASAAGVSYGAPVARFGDESGLLAAVAERGFRLLEQELAGAPGDATALALRYVEFALRRRNLHRAMYHPDLWSAEAKPLGKDSGGPAAEVEVSGAAGGNGAGGRDGGD